MKTTPTLSRSPFVELMLHPEKLAAALKAARTENDAFAAARKYARSATTSATAGGSPRPDGAGTSTHPAPPELREIEFQLDAPGAGSVMLAASFTAWEKFPLDMVKMRDGLWSIFVSLLPGIYAYRFIVDGRWWDDPGADLHLPGSSGLGSPALKIV